MRPFGHVSVVDDSPALDASALMPKAAALHTEMIFSKILDGYALDSQEPFSKPARLSSPKVESDRSTTRLDGLAPEWMKTAHGLAETRRMIGKVVIAT